MLWAWFLLHWCGGTWEQESLPLGWVGWDSVRGVGLEFWKALRCSPQGIIRPQMQLVENLS